MTMPFTHKKDEVRATGTLEARTPGDQAVQVLLYVIIALVALACVLPFIYVVAGSFATERELTERPFFLIPQDVSLNAYQYILKQGDVFRGLKNSVIVTVIGTLINMFVSCTIAYPLSRPYLKGRNGFINMVIVTMLFTGGMVSMIIGYTMLALFSSNLPVVIVALIFFYVPAQFIQMTAILSLTDSIEYGQLKNGKRNEAVTLSVRPMLDKIGGALSNGITGFIAVAAGMTGNATAADMTPSNIHTFEICAFYVPLILIVLSLLVFMFKVKIDEKMHAKIVKELEAKLASGEIVDDEAQTAETVEAIDEEAKTLTE